MPIIKGLWKDQLTWWKQTPEQWKFCSKRSDKVCINILWDSLILWTEHAAQKYPGYTTVLLLLLTTQLKVKGIQMNTEEEKKKKNQIMSSSKAW